MVFDKYNDVTHFIASIYFIGLLKIQFLDQNENFKVKVNKIRAPPPHLFRINKNMNTQNPSKCSLFYMHNLCSKFYLLNNLNYVLRNYNTS